MFNWLRKWLGEPIKVKWIPYDDVTVKLALQETFPEAEIKMTDRKYHVQPSKIVHDWLLQFDGYRKFDMDVFDCDDYAFWFKAFMALKFKLNSVGYAQGLKAKSYHAFNIAYCLDGVHLIEPQAPMIWNVKFNKYLQYNPKFILI